MNMGEEQRYPLISIVTVCYNAGIALKKTVESVCSQTFSDWELIIKDGNSIDGSVDYIKGLDSRIKIIVEDDSGIYNAMNRGIKEVKGKFVLFLNAGDLLADENVLKDIVTFCKSQVADVYYGNYVNSQKEQCIAPKKITRFFLFSSFLCHQTVIYAIGSLNKYDENLKILADHELHISMLLDGKKFKAMPIFVCKYEGGGISEKSEYKEIYNIELKKIREKHFSRIERVGYNLRYYLTVPRIRAFMYGPKSPTWIRKIYRRIVTIIRS